MAFSRALAKLLSGEYGDDLSDEISRQTGGNIKPHFPVLSQLINQQLTPLVAQHSFYRAGEEGLTSELARVAPNTDFVPSIMRGIKGALTKNKAGRFAQEGIELGETAVQTGERAVGALERGRGIAGDLGISTEAIGRRVGSAFEGLEGATGALGGLGEGLASSLASEIGAGISTAGAIGKSLPNPTGLLIGGSIKAATDVLSGKGKYYDAGWRLTDDITPGYEGEPGEIRGATKEASTDIYKGETGQGRFGDDRTTKEWLSSIVGGIRGVIRPEVQKLVGQGYTPKEARERLRNPPPSFSHF